MSEHKISYTGKLGSKHKGYKWYCTCGASSGPVPWADRRERTWEAHRHLESLTWNDDEPLVPCRPLDDWAETRKRIIKRIIA